MGSKVYFVNYWGRQGRSLEDKLGLLWDAAGFDAMVRPGEIVGVKVHFGERGNTAYLRPEYARVAVDRLRRAGARPFLTDANTLYLGSRSDAVSHLETAARHGFSWGTVDAPIVIADGLRGRDHVKVRIDLKHFKECWVASAAYHADGLVILSHFKGHNLAGYGAAIKNLGMGLASRAGKQQQHSAVTPRISAKACVRCGECARWCPVGAIALVDGVMTIDAGRCIGCGECVSVCRHGAVRVQWKTDAADFMERMAEYAFAVRQGKEEKIVYLTFLTDITPDCDCHPFSGPFLVPPVGVLASWDPVAIDRAALDLFDRAVGLPGSAAEGLSPGVDKVRSIRNLNVGPLFDHAERIGLGSREYELEDLDADEGPYEMTC